MYVCVCVCVCCVSILKFTYSVEWTETTDSYATRFTRYLDLDFFQHQIHW